MIKKSNQKLHIPLPSLFPRKLFEINLAIYVCIICFHSNLVETGRLEIKFEYRKNIRKHHI